MIQGEKIIATDLQRSDVAELDERCFWAVWREGRELPRIYTRKALAVTEGRRKAAAAPGVTFWLMKVEPRGAIHFPDAPIVAGEFSDVAGPHTAGDAVASDEIGKRDDSALSLWWP